MSVTINVFGRQVGKTRLAEKQLVAKLAKEIAEEEDREVLSILTAAYYEERGYRRALDSTPLGIGRRLIGLIEAENNALDGRTAGVILPCFVEEDAEGRRWWRELTPFETLSLLVEEDL